MVDTASRLIRWCTRVGLCVALGGFGAAAANAQPLAIEDLARFEAVTGISLSPDGKHLAGLVAAPGQKWPVISIWKADALSERPIWIPSERQRPIQVQFMGNERLLFITEQEINFGPTKTFTRKAYVTDLKGSFFEELLRRGGAANDVVRNAESTGFVTRVFARLSDQNVVLLERTNVGDSGVQEIFRVDTRTMRATLVAEGSEKSRFMSAGVDAETGDLRLRQRVENIGGDFWLQRDYRKTSRESWVYQPQLSYALKKRRTIAPIDFDTDPTRLIVATDHDARFAQIRSYDVVNQRFDPEPMFSNDRYPLVDVYFGSDDKADGKTEVIGVIVGGPSSEGIFTDDFWAPILAQLKQLFPGQLITMGSRQRSNHRALVRVESDALPVQYYLLTLKPELALAEIGGQRPWIDPKTLGPSRWLTYRARDGLEIPAILTLPPGWTRDKGPIPAVVHPHGGPWGRDYLEWDGSGWTQFLATRGYAVLRPQFRGSDGLGLELNLAGDENWGLKMQDDKDDGAAWLVEQGIADARKVAIFGYSYGGFAAIAASVRPKGPYVCALSGAGVSSLQLIQNEWGEDRINKERQAWTVKGMDPLKNVDKADIPILLFHGDRDRQADTEHSRLFYRAMKSAGKDVQYVEIKDMWHSAPWRPEWHRQTLKLIEDWLAGPKCFGGPGKTQVAAR
jgi:dipeptidyl aminopeptidase/acylaminoacyl peptidase